MGKTGSNPVIGIRPKQVSKLLVDEVNTGSVLTISANN